MPDMNPCLRTASLEDILEQRVVPTFEPVTWASRTIVGYTDVFLALTSLYDAEERLRRR